VNNLTVNLNPNNITVNLDKTNPVDDTNAEILSATEKILPKGEMMSNKLKNPVSDKISVPKSFDVFVDDLKSSTALPDNDNDLNSPQEFNLNNPKLKMMTSSVGDDLHKDFSSKDIFKNRLNRPANLLTNKNLTSSNFDLNEIQETSSPFRPLLQKTNLNQSYTILKQSIDFAEIESQKKSLVHVKPIKVDSKRNKFDSNESLDDNDEETSSKSSSTTYSTENNMQQTEADKNHPRTVFNQTYTSWDTNEDQLQAETMKQHQTFQGIKANLTQDIRAEEEFRQNLNTTMDIIGKSLENFFYTLIYIQSRN